MNSRAVLGAFSFFLGTAATLVGGLVGTRWSSSIYAKPLVEPNTWPLIAAGAVLLLAGVALLLPGRWTRHGAGDAQQPPAS